MKRNHDWHLLESHSTAPRAMYELLAPLGTGGMATVHLARMVEEDGATRPVVVKQPYTDDDGLLMDIQPGAAAIHYLHDDPPATQPPNRLAGQMPVSPETNTRASRHQAVITIQCAVRHPDQSNVQAHDTKQTATLGPALRDEIVPFSCISVRRSRMDI